MSIQPEQLIEIAKRVLRILNMQTWGELRIIYASKLLEEWRVNFSYIRTGTIYASKGCFSVNAETEEITGMWLDRQWQ